ncbi:MAG: class I SAM-dependent methyltransferase [Pseudomonadota bacterium]
MLQAQLVNLFEQRLRGMNLPLNVEFWNGKRVSLGDFPKVKLVLRRPAALKALARPGLGKIGRAYVEGDIDIDCDIHDLVEFAESLCGPQQVDLKKRDSDNWKWWWHTRLFDRRAINQHYDVSNEFFALWLDRQRVYSCAYFRKPDDSLDLAQQQKIDHICRKLNLQRGERLLDIGCGWGALIFRAAEQYGAHATGITLSEQQFAFVQEQIRARNLADRCDVRLLDYRDVPEDLPFDKIASVGMFEHVGKKKLPGYFAKIYRLLKPGGLVMNHGLTSVGLYSGGLSSDVADFVEHYVFPGGEIPHLSKEIELMARENLECLDVECLRPHYAKTLWHWVERLDARKNEARALVGEKKYRTWRVYMAGYALAFQRGWVSVDQVLATRPLPNGALSTPLTREHVYRG